MHNFGIIIGIIISLVPNIHHITYGLEITRAKIFFLYVGWQILFTFTFLVEEINEPKFKRDLYFGFLIPQIFILIYKLL